MKKFKFFMLMVIVSVLMLMLEVIANAEIVNNISNSEITDNSQNIVDAGTCGEKANWVLREDGALVVYGEGEVTDYSGYRKYREKITQVRIENGITRLCTGAFGGFMNIENLYIPSTMISISANAFTYYYSIGNVYIEDLEKWCSINIENADGNPLYKAKNTYVNNKLIKDLEIPEGVKQINKYAFYNIKSIISVRLPNSVKKIDYDAFSGCSNIKTVYYDGTREEWNEVFIVHANNTLYASENSNKPLLEATVQFLPCTRTSVYGYRNFKAVTITPSSVDIGCAIFLALYDGDRCVETHTALYEGNDIVFITDAVYTNAKVMVWEDFENMRPLCTPETI